MPARPPWLLLIAPLATVLQAEPLKVILDTDMGGGHCIDVDDVGTLCMLNALADNGEVELLAVVLNTRSVYSAGVISVIQHYYSRDWVPIGALKGGTPVRAHSYVGMLVSGWPSPIKSSEQVPSAVSVYRRVLAQQADHSVVVASVGMMTNLADLFRSGPDQYSPLDGHTLFTLKVRRIGVMAGEYPSGRECNMCGDSAASAFVFSHFPTSVSVFFLGGWVGSRIQTGAKMSSCTSASNPCRQAYIEYLGGRDRGRSSWDPLTALVAVRGVSAARLGFCENCAGHNVVSDNCFNVWTDGKYSNQTYVTLDPQNISRAADEVDQLLCQLPLNLPQPPQPPPFPLAPPSLPSKWEAHANTNCYSDRGAIIVGAEPCCHVASVDDCKSHCQATPACTAIVVPNRQWNGFRCYLRSAISLERCERDGSWTTHTLSWASPLPIPPASPPAPQPPGVPPQVQPPQPPQAPMPSSPSSPPEIPLFQPTPPPPRPWPPPPKLAKVPLPKLSPLPSPDTATPVSPSAPMAMPSRVTASVTPASMVPLALIALVVAFVCLAWTWRKVHPITCNSPSNISEVRTGCTLWRSRRSRAFVELGETNNAMTTTASTHGQEAPSFCEIPSPGPAQHSVSARPL